MTRPQWTADIAIDAALASRLVLAQFPELRAERIRPLGSGWDNAAFLVDERIVFRFPRRRVFASLLEREIALLPGFPTSLPLAIPRPTWVGAAVAEFPWSFAGYAVLPGRTACSGEPSDAERAMSAEPLGRFLRALHAIDPSPFVARGLPPDEIGRLDPIKRLRFARERVPALDAAGVAGDLDRYITWLAEHPPPAIADDARRIVHGDLYARHVLLDARFVPTGVIDWGDVHLGDPALDLAIAHLVLPAASHARFREAYGPIDARTWEAARYRAIYHAILELDYGLRENDVGMRRIGTDALRLIGGSLG